MTKKLKWKKIYWLYLALALFVALLIWIFNRPATADVCSAELNVCLLKGKVQGFWDKMGSGFGCVWNNLGCLIKSFF